MSSAADAIDLRRLVDRAVPLEAPSVKKAAHPIGFGLERDKTYAHPNGRVALPIKDVGLANLRQTTSRDYGLPTPGMTMAWRALLKNPELVVPLAAASEEQLSREGIALPRETDLRRVRRLGLGVVAFTPGEQIEDGYLSFERIAGVARLTVLVKSHNPKQSDNAWLEVRWSRSTLELARSLEELAAEVGPGAFAASLRSSAICVVQPAVSAVIDIDVTDRMRMAAAVHGFDLRVIRRETADLGSVLTTLRRATPNLLIVLGRPDAEAENLLGEHRSAATTGKQRIIDPEDSWHALMAARETFSELVGVGPALLPVGVPPTPKIVFARPAMGVGRTGDCLHDVSHRAYVEDLDTGLWWTRDTAGHAGSVFKTYTLADGRLDHYQDLTGECAVIDKAKGEAGRVIYTRDLNPCGHGPHIY